ncbi:hypothetical protein K523DRAFT_311473 [Schizophyllum commune Tattone D]|nr:hypothetical protein K523DRAFT_311473 [Schizophyllum commune Tattone D]
MSHQPAQRPSMTASTRHRQPDQTSHQLYYQSFDSSSVAEPYRSMARELSTQLYDATSTYADTDHNYSTDAIESMDRLGTTAHGYKRENHVQRTLGEWVDAFKCLGKAEQKTRALLGSLSTLRLPASRETRTTSTTRRGASRSMTLPTYNSPYLIPENPASAQYAPAAETLGDTRVPAAHSGYVMRREFVNGDPSNEGNVARVKHAQLLDSLIDTTPCITVGGRSAWLDRHVLALCNEVERVAAEGIDALRKLNSDFYKSSSAWESVASSFSQSTNTLYHVISATANIVGEVAQGMDNGPTKATLGGIGVTLKEAAGFLQRKLEDPNNTQTTASNAHAAAEDLRYNAQMFLMAYIELQAIIKKILTMRKDRTPFTSEEKQRIAQFFYSFSRHFDTLSKSSIEHTAREGYHKFAQSRSGRQASTDFFPEFDHVTELGDAASAIKEHCTSLGDLLWYAHDGTQNIMPIRDAMRSVANHLELLKTAIAALEGIFRTIQRIIISPSDTTDEALSTLASAYQLAMTDFRRVVSAAENVMEVLSKSEGEALASIAYPPGLHFLLVEVLGVQWNDRLYALAKLSHFFQRVQEDVDRIASATVQLQLSIQGLQERFSVTKMLEYRDLDLERQLQVKHFLSRTCHALESWIDHISFDGESIRQYDRPVLKLPRPGAHNRPV